MRVVRSVSKELARRHEVTVYATSALDHRRDFGVSPTEVKLDGYRVVYFPRIFKFSKFNFSTAMTKTLRQTLNEYDIIHLHSWRHFQDVIVNYYAKSRGVPYVLQTHGSLPRGAEKQGLKWIYDMSFGHRLLTDASKVIATTKMEAEQCRNVGVPERKIEIIPNGIDESEFNNLPKRSTFRKKYNIDNGEKLILYMGRIHKIKGIDTLINAYACISKELHDTKLAIVGPDDGYLSACKELATQLRVEEKILFLGPLYGSAKLEAYVDADACAVPSKYEIFGMTILEACACAKPVVATNVCGAALDIITNGHTGFLVQPENVHELTEAIKHILTNEAESRKMGMQAREHVMNMFSIESIVVKLENLYKEILREA